VVKREQSKSSQKKI
jgi:flagellar motility protein MotE (MotC chaperone)